MAAEHGEKAPPTLPEILSFKCRSKSEPINITQQIGPNECRCFGVHLLKDDNGAIVEGIMAGKNIQDANHEIIVRWLQGRGMQPVAWSTLTDAMRKSQLCNLADDIEKTMNVVKTKDESKIAATSATKDNHFVQDGTLDDTFMETSLMSEANKDKNTTSPEDKKLVIEGKSTDIDPTVVELPAVISIQNEPEHPKASQTIDIGSKFRISDAIKGKDYYTIVLLGKTGQGKSTAGNKLLGIGGTRTPKIKEWTCQTEKGLLKSSNTNEMLSFKAANSRESVTKQCQMLSNEDTHIRVLDVPGFGDSKQKENQTTIQVNAGFINAIIEVQEKMHVTYNRILYFLPFRGTPERADGYLQDELQLLFHYFGRSIFQCMIIIATQDKKYQKYDFGSDDIESLIQLVKTALRISTEQVMNIECPPIIYLPLAACPEEVLCQIKTANVLNNSVLTARQSVPIYKGEDHWEDWVVKFEKVAHDEFKDDDKAKLVFFKSHLADNVKSMCLSSFLQTDDYKAVKQKFEENLYLKVFSDRDIQVPYSGDGDETYWEQWITHFEKKASHRKLDEARKLQWLEGKLISGARGMVDSLHSDERRSYALVKKALQKQVYTKCLEKRGKKPSEEIGDYAALLLRMTMYAYPDATQQARERPVLNHLKPYLHPSIQSREWKSVDEALTINCAVNAITEEFTSDQSKGWDIWLEKFTSKCEECHLDKSKYLLWFESRLSGEAMECYCTLPKQLREDYKTAVNSFQSKLYKNSFEDKCHRGKNVKESLKHWAQELLQLIAKAYPDMSQANRDTEVIKQILHATEKHFDLQPGTVKEAVNFVCADHEIPNAFTGARGWNEWIRKAEAYLCQPGTNMTDHEKLRCIQTRLSGKALEIFRSLSQHEMSSFESAIAGFEEKLLHHWLENRKKEKSEGWNIYVEDLLSLGKRVYSIQRSEQLVLNNVLPQVDETLQSRKWASLNEAVNAIMAKEVLPPYSNIEKENWRLWRAKLESEINNRGLDNEKKLTWLSSRLAGDAKQAFDELNCSDYDTAINTLEKKLYKRRFESRTKKPSETWEQLHNHLCSLAADCYSSASDIECAVFKQICSIMKINGTDLCVDPLSADDAVLIVSAQEAVPDTFSGTENWETWIRNVNKALSENKIVDDSKQIRFLRVRLTGTALQLFNTVCSTSNIYRKVLKALEYEIYKEQFESRSKKPGESWEQFVDDLRNLGKNIFENSELSKCLKDKILNDDNVGTAVRAENPKNVEEAAVIAQAMDSVTESFSGDVDQWDKWIAMFEKKANQYQLKDCDMLTWFRVSLTGDARHMCNQVTSKSYVDSKQAVQVSLFKKAFESKKKNTYEDVDKLVDTLLWYAREAFPGEDVKRCTLDRLKEIMQENGELDYDKLPLSTLEEAVTTFIALEEMNNNQYKEGEDWELWIRCFENIAERNKLVDNDKIQWLKACVTGKALEIVQKCPPGCTYESVKTSISIEFENVKEAERLSLIGCPKCSGKGNDPNCHTQMVYPSEKKSGLTQTVWKLGELIASIFTSVDKVCEHCEKGFGTPGCTPIGDCAKHDCT